MADFDENTGEVIEAPSLRVPDTHIQHGSLLSSPETTEVWGALIEAQAKIEPPQRTKTAKVKGEASNGRTYEYEYKYAPLDEILAKSRGPLQEFGLGFQQFLARSGNQPLVRTIIFHKSGQWTAVDYPIFADARKGAQGFASGVTYARRYGLTLALGLAPEDDDDANVADALPAEISPSPPRATKITPAVSKPSPAPEIAQRIRREITKAMFLEQLNATGLFGPSAEHDQKVIMGQEGGDKVWADLVRRDADRRLELADG